MRPAMDLDGVLDAGVELQVRRTANLHTGGTIHDVTDVLHPALADAASGQRQPSTCRWPASTSWSRARRGPSTCVIEVNEQPGLANHEPQPTAQRYLDLLFPATAR